jgi:hypothetical protein
MGRKTTGWELEEERNWGGREGREDLEVEGVVEPPKKRLRRRDWEQR